MPHVGRRRGSRFIAIWDPSLFAQILRALFNGRTQGEAAAVLAVDRSFYKRLLRQEVGSLTKGTFEKIGAEIRRRRSSGHGDPLLGRLWESTLRVEDREALDEYDSWLARELYPYGILAETVTDRAAGLRPRPPDLGRRSGAYVDPAHRLCRALLEQLRRSRSHRSYFKPIDRREASVGPARAMLAALRAVYPLALAATTGGIERSMGELERAGELEPYLKAAVAREEILLRRDSEVLRAQMLARQGRNT